MNSRKLLFLRLLLFSCLGIGAGANAQVVATITATGSPGSFITGSVNAAGTMNDGLMVNVTTLNNRAWAVFDLSSIPSGSVINSVNLVFTTTSNSVLSSVANFIGGYQWTSSTDPATMGGAALFTQLATNATTAFNNTTWTPNASNTKAFNANGVSLISNSLGGQVVISFVRGSTNSYEIYGYDAPSASQAPQLVIDYLPSTPCSGGPVAGAATAPVSAVCPGTSFTLSLFGATAASGLSYQWYESPSGSGAFTPISGATNATYTVTNLTANTDYQAEVTCTNPGGGTATSSPVSISLNSFLNCYCTSNATSTADEEILNVTFNSMNNSSTCTSTGGPGSIQNQYSDYTTIVPAEQVMQGATVPFSVQVGTCGGNYGNWTKMYIDYNQNGLFTDPGEEVYSNTASATGPNTQSGSITIPLTATPGVTRMRVVVVETTVATGVNPCGTYTWGETEDYLVEIVPAVGCTGAPVAGTIGSSASSVCTGQAFTLTATGYTIGSGITFEWQANTGSGFTAIAGATNPSYTVPSQSIQTDYQLVITCTNPGGGSATSNIVTVGQNTFLNCYCSSAATFTGNEDILNVTFNSLNNTSTCTTTGGPGSTLNLYSDYTTIVPAEQVMQGSTVPFSVQVGTCGGNFSNWTKAYIDYNQNGLFTDPGEEVFSNTASVSGPNTQTGSITIPLTATPGVTRMRVVNTETTVATGVNPCGTYGYGETEDYLVEIIPAVGCTGAPVAGTVGASANSVCTGQAFTLTATGYTIGSGITFEWQANTGSGFTAIAGATNPSYTVPSQSVQTDYQLIVTCPNPGGGSATSNTVTVGQNTFLNCYCTSNATSTADEEILNVTFNSMSNSSTCTTTGGPGSIQNQYSDYTTIVPAEQVMQGATVSFSVQVGTCGGNYGNWTKMYIDYNQNGLFTDPGEEVYSNTASATGPNTQSGSITIPLTATPGVTRMRVVVVETTVATGVNPCGTYIWGETEDYLVEIVPAVGCTGAPVAGTIGASVSNVCTGQAFTLTATGYTIGSGITFEWQANTGSGFTAIAGATNPSYTVPSQSVQTDYQLVVTCTNPGGGSTTSNTVTIAQNAALSCYCTPVYTTGCTANDNINDFTLTGENATAFNDLATGCSTNGYDDRTAQPAVDLAQGVTYNGTISSTYGSLENARVWVDFGDDGVFDATDEIGQISSITTAGIPYSVTIPATATLGNHRMRVRLVYNTAANLIDPCASYTYGETHDYTVNIIAAPLAITLGDISATNIGNRNRVDWNSMHEDAGDKYQIERSANGRDFVTVGQVNGKAQAAHYTFFDENPVSGVNYYRLQMLHSNGTRTYSKTVAATVKNSDAFNVLAYPNPVTGSDVTIEVRGEIASGAIVTVSDITGKLVARQEVLGNMTKVDLSKLGAGVYLIKYQDAGHSQTVKVTKQ